MPAQIVEIEHDGFVLSTDPSRIDVAAVHAFLSGESYWAVGRTLETQRRAIEHSHLVAGAYDRRGAQVGFARMVTDLATYAWLADVYVDGSVRGRGVGVQLVRLLVEHPDVRDVTWQFLATRDAHALYERFGFTPLADPARWMHRRGS